jgi:hypothetical protein
MEVSLDCLSDSTDLIELFVAAITKRPVLGVAASANVKGLVSLGLILHLVALEVGPDDKCGGEL